MEDKNILVVNYIQTVADILKRRGVDIPTETISHYIKKYQDSPKAFEEIKEEIDSLVEEKIRENQMQDVKKEREYILNDLFNCRISNNSLHLHVIPDSVREDIIKAGGRNEYFNTVESKLEDALNKLPIILENPDNQDVNTILAVSPTLKISKLQEMFTKRGFTFRFTHENKFIEMFNTEKIGLASISKKDFMERYNVKTKENDILSMFNDNRVKQKDKGQVKVKKIENHNSDANKGFVSTIILSAIIIFILLVIIIYICT